MRARILRIEDAEMKVGLSGLNVDEAAAPPAAEAEATPTAEPAPAAEEAAPKKKRTRKKADEAATE